MTATGPAAGGLLGRWLHIVPIAAVCRLYRPPTGMAGRAEPLPDPGRGQRLAAIVAAYHQHTPTGAPLVFGWARPAATGPVTVLASTPVTAEPGRPGGGALRFPPGGHGRPLTGDDVAGLLTALPAWTRVTGVVDGLLLDQHADNPGPGMRPSLEDCLLDAWHDPFAWLLLAEPLSASAIRDEAVGAAAGERDARTRTSSPEYALRADRLGHRHRELRTAAATGVWRVHVLAGAADPASASAVAGLLVASTDLTGLPYALAPGSVVADLEATLTAMVEGVDDVGASPFTATSALVAVLARPPGVEIPGVRHIQRPTFDVTAETTTTGGIDLGTVLDRTAAPAGQMRLPADSLNRHVFVTGATGAGKSQTIRHLLEQATRAGIPWLVIEPAKAEYRRMAARLPDVEVVVVRPGDPDAVPVGLNPLQPAARFPLQTHADLVRALFTAAFDADDPFPQVLAAALTRCYTDLGWDLTLSQPRNPKVTPRYPTLTDLELTAAKVVAEIGYGQEVADNVRGFIAVRLGSLRLGTAGGFLHGSQPLDFDALLNRNVVLEIEDVGDDRDKAFLIGAVLIRLAEHLRARDRATPHPGGLRHLTVVEEAHRLLRRPDQPGPAAHAVELFADLLAEVRAYGEGLIIADQIPAKLLPDVIKNTAVKIVHRLPAADDRDAVGATMNLTDDQSDHLVTLTPGTAAVFTDGMDHPVLTRLPDGSHREHHPARPASPALLIADDPDAGSHCQRAGCTLRQQVTARRFLDTHPLITVWAELAVLGHLVDLPAPAPRADLATALRDAPDRLRECAIDKAVAAAVGARSAALADTHSPASFAAHVATELARQLTTPAAGCDTPAGAWLAAQFRWNPIRLALTTYLDGHPDADPHPDTGRWEAEHGRPIAGRTARAQLDTVIRWSRQLVRDRATAEVVLFGNPSHLEAIMGTGRRDADWEPVLGHVLTAFTAADGWPRLILADADR